MDVEGAPQVSEEGDVHKEPLRAQRRTASLLLQLARSLSLSTAIIPGMTVKILDFI